MNFEELFQRHLCRHGEYGINVLHLLSVVVVYFSIIELLTLLPHHLWMLASGFAIYTCLIACNLPFGMLILNSLFLLALIGFCFLVPTLPPIFSFGYVLLIVASHRFQLWSHRVYTQHFDMSPFQQKYPKGPRLFTLLLIYELPILLNYFRFHRKSAIYPHQT